MEMESVAAATDAEIKKTNNEEEQEAMCYGMQLVNSLVLPMVLRTAFQLNVFQIIARAGPGAQLSASEVASKIQEARNPEAPVMLDMMFRLLASHSILTCTGVDAGNGRLRRVYGLTPVAMYFVPNEDGVTFGHAMDLIHDKVFVDSWYELKNSILEGGVPFDRVHGMHAFDYPAKDPRFNEIFNKAMINNTTIVIKNILECYKGFENLKQLVDVGGGLGVTLNLITSKYPNIKGINFDLPHVIQHAPTYPGVEHIGGDMFKSVPKGDAIFIKWILHDWSDERCLKLLKNCYKALPDNGKVIVMESILPEIPNTSTSVKSITQGDLLMMTQNSGGKERTEQEFTALAVGAGFKGIRLACFACNFWIMEFYK